MSVRTGSCLCGSIQIEINGDPFMRNLCHCSSCQKCTGSPFGSLATYKTEQVTYTESEPSVMKTYIDTSPESGAVLERSFCGKCGSPVRGQRKSTPEQVVLPTGIIDGDKAAFKPDAEFFYRGKADWIGGVEGSKTFDTLPSS